MVAYNLSMDVFQALADPNRRSIMAQLKTDHELSISELNSKHNISRQALTKHLNKLVEAGIIVKRKEGKNSLHSLNPQSLKTVAEWLKPYAALWDQRLEKLTNFTEQQMKKHE
jgi:DNA-binding transcriptional ArsR family regulator